MIVLIFLVEAASLCQEDREFLQGLTDNKREKKELEKCISCTSSLSGVGEKRGKEWVHTQDARGAKSHVENKQEMDQAMKMELFGLLNI